MTYKEGDRVLIVDKRSCSFASLGEMDRYLNTIMTITEIAEFETIYGTMYRMYEDGGYWNWFEHDFVGKVIDDNILVKEEC